MKTSRVVQPEHFEYRFLVAADQGDEIQEFLSEYLEWDEHVLEHENHAYSVHDYYLDNDKWDIYWRSLDVGASNPHLRFRCYGEEPDDSIYAETKRHLNNRVIKHSTVIPRADIELLLSGLIPDAQDIPPGAEPEVAVEHFCHSVVLHQAAPKVHVTFAREAWRNEELPVDKVRVTLDQHCRCALMNDTSFFPVSMESPHDIYPGLLVLELKFIERYPDWFRDLTREFECLPMGTAKYIKSAQILGGAQITASDTTLF